MIEIRQATKTDADFIISAQVALATETESLSLDRDTVTAGVGAVFDDPAKGTYYIADEDGECIGCLMVTPEWSDWRNATVLWLQSVYVRPEDRGRGVFRALYAHMLELVKSTESIAGLRLYVDKSNSAAMSAYEKLGMDGHHYQTYEWMKT